MRDKEVEQNLAKKYEGKLFVHLWVSCSFGNKFYVHKDYYTVVNGVVHAIENDGRLFPSGDKCFSLYQDCNQIGKYDPKKKYKRVFKTYSYSEFKKLHKL